jgi:hypothetical protein
VTTYLRTISAACTFAIGIMSAGCAHHAGCGHHDGCTGHQDEHHGHAGEEHNAANVTEHVDAVFAELDADGDKALSRDEVTGHRLEARFTEVDADGDGHISYDEMTTFGRRMHGQAD